MSEQARTQSALVILRRIYLDAISIVSKPKTVLTCAAKLIEYFKHWCQWKASNYRSDWVYMPLKHIYDDLMGEHSLHVIRAAIAHLGELGLLHRQQNNLASNGRNGQEKTWQYRLDTERLQSLLGEDAVEFRSEDGKHEFEHTKHSSVVGECKSELSKFTVEQDTQNTYTETHTKILSQEPPQGYSSHVKGLNELERECFERFVREEWKHLTAKNGESGQEIVSIERFLSKAEDFNNWYERFKCSAAGKAVQAEAVAQEKDWRNQPCFDLWIQEAFNRGDEWVNENKQEQQDRALFYDWAFKVNAFLGVCYELST